MPSNTDRIETEPVTPGTLVFDPVLPDNPFGLAGTIFTLDQPAQLDRETRDLYTLPLKATSLSGDTAYATVSWGKPAG